MLLRTLVCTTLLILGTGHSAFAADALEEFREAMSDNDAYAKRDAINALASSGLDEDTVLELLVQAASDRQASRYAIPALRRKTGLKPPKGESTGYPDYPTADTGSAWSQWLSARKAEQAEQAQLKEAVETAEAAKQEAQEAKEEAQAAKEGTDGEAPTDSEDAETTEGAENAEGEGEGQTDGESGPKDENNESQEGAEEPTPSTGPRDKLDRIFFTDGSVLRCYVVLKRTDLSGELTSVRILHKDGGGEEIIDAALIARIEEDYQQ